VIAYRDKESCPVSLCVFIAPLQQQWPIMSLSSLTTYAKKDGIWIALVVVEFILQHR
jgi:hypothetical protein